MASGTRRSPVVPLRVVRSLQVMPIGAWSGRRGTGCSSWAGPLTRSAACLRDHATVPGTLITARDVRVHDRPGAARRTPFLPIDRGGEPRDLDNSYGVGMR